MKPTDKVKAKIETGQITKFDLAKELGIGRPTLDRRLKNEKWKKGEIAIIQML